MKSQSFNYCSFIFSLFFVSPLVFAQATDFDVKYPRMNEGRMFTIKLIPAAKTTRIYVIGKEAVKIKMADVGLSISLTGKSDETPLPTSLDGDHFIMTLPTEQLSAVSRLKLNVKYRDKTEDIEVPIELKPR